MATNPLIALQGNNPDPVGSYYNGQRMQQQSDLNKQNMKMNDEQLVQQRIANTSARDKARIESIYYGAASLQPYLDNNDKEGALRMLEARRNNLRARQAAGEGVDANDTEDAIQRITQDFESFKKLNKSVVDSGSLFGFAPRPENMGGATGHIIEKLMADNPGMSYTDALYMYQTGARNGLQRQADGSIAPIPGYAESQGNIAGAKEYGKQQGGYLAEGQNNLPKTYGRLQAFEDKSANLLGTIDEARQLATNGNVTGWGSLLKAQPGSDALSLAEKIKTIKANVGFDELQKMRENSPTGGALGSVSEQENELLQAVVASLNQAQSQEEFLRSLDKVQKQLIQSRQRLREAYARDVQRFGAENVPDISGFVGGASPQQQPGSQQPQQQAAQPAKANIAQPPPGFEFD